MPESSEKKAVLNIFHNSTTKIADKLPAYRFLLVSGLLLGATYPVLANDISISVEESNIYAVPYNAKPVIEKRINTLDVDKLSKYARLLRANHMVRLSFAPTKKSEVSKSVSNWHSFIENAAEENLLPYELIRAVIEVESGFVVDAVSSCGAQGLMQLMPKTQNELGVKDPFDPNENISAGSRYLASLLNMFDGDLELALAAYNGGMGNVKKYGGIPPFTETINFVRKVTTRYRALQQANQH